MTKVNEAIQSLVNRAAVACMQNADTCVNAVTVISNKTDKTPADNARVEAYRKKSEEFKAVGMDLRAMADQLQVGTPTHANETPSNS
ncbi:MAG: hypothetical protein K2X50_04015 [Gammaproteobacteria bacterium]|nr:hypothetical protein [Gammaproteobacteria bacterium]